MHLDTKDGGIVVVDDMFSYCYYYYFGY